MALEVLAPPALNPIGNIVFLHGWGANHRDLLELVPYLQLPEYQFFLPNGLFPHQFTDTGRMWYSFTRAGHLTATSREELATSRAQLREWLLALPEQTGIPLERTWLGGFSQGGAMTLDVGMFLPLAGLIVMSGYLHPELAAPTACPPVAILHGRQDEVVPIDRAWQARQQIIDWGGTVQYQELEMGHDVVPAELQTIRQFVKERSL